MHLRWLLALVTVAACERTAPPPATPKNDAPPAPAPATATIRSLLGPDGTHFAAERVYEGQCAPPGSRGGCVSFTFKPDGTYRSVQYDMVMDGTYEVAGTTVTLHYEVPGEGDEMTLSPDGRMLGELPLER